jgi:hypothetical protein
MVPFLLPQALYVRKTAPRFAPAGGPATGSAGSGNQIHLLAIGDSIIAGVGATELSKALVGRTAAAIAASLNCCVSWRAHGVSGYNSTKILNRLVPELPDVAADYIIVSVGVNDITGLTTLRKWRQNLSLLLDKLQAHSPNAVVAVAGMPPMHRFPLLPQPLWATFGMRSGSRILCMYRSTLNRISTSLRPMDIIRQRIATRISVGTWRTGYSGLRNNEFWRVQALQQIQLSAPVAMRLFSRLAKRKRR